MKCFALSVVAAGLATAQANLDTLCANQPGYAQNEYIVGENAWNYINDNSVAVTAIKAWNESEPISIIAGCPVKYDLLFGDQVHVMFTYEGEHDSITFEWSQEAQVLEEVEKDLKFLFAWETHYQSQHKPNGGMTSSPLFNDRMLPDLYGYTWGYWSNPPDYLRTDAYPVSWAPSWLGLSGLYEFQADSKAQDVNEQRHDFYHQAADRSPYGYYTYQEARHSGPEDGKLRIVLYASDSDMIVPGLDAETTRFTGTMTLNTKDETGSMLEADYTALKNFYLDACSGTNGVRRGRADPYAPWQQSDDPNFWTRHKHFSDVGRDYMEIPYCTWLQTTGWNQSWDNYLNTAGGTCHLIDQVTCDGDGHIITLYLGETGVKGDATTLLQTLSKLQEFSAVFNIIQGSLPQNSGFVTANTITTFNIWHNDMHGQLPCFGDMLTYVDVSKNKFDGTLPSCGVAKSATTWWLENNFLMGTIPPEYGDMSNLNLFAAMYNQLTGSLPSTLCKWTDMGTIMLDGNKLEGSVPTGCLDSGTDTAGWLTLRYLELSHNRLTGSVPIMDRHRFTNTTEAGNPNCFTRRRTGDSYHRRRRACSMGSYYFNHNFFEGTIGTRLQSVVDLAREIDGTMTLQLAGNRLYGTLPSMIRDWSFVQSLGHINYNFIDNYFRCQPDGRWPDWADRTVRANQFLGKCLPVAHPKSISPVNWTVGQAGMLAVTGEDFVQRGDHSCLFISTSDSTRKEALATRETDTLIRCIVPIDLQVGTYQVTVSNFGDDYADTAKLSILGALPTVKILEPPVVESAGTVTTSMTLGGIDSSEFNAADFAAAIAALLGVDPSDITVLGAQSTRRLQTSSGSSLTVNFVVHTDNTDMNYNQIVEALSNEESVKTELTNKGVNVATVGTEVAPIITTEVTEVTTEKEIPVVWIIVAAAGGLLACGLCCFIGFLYRMEKKGQAYFKETLDDDAGAASPGTTIGKTTENNEV